MEWNIDSDTMNLIGAPLAREIGVVPLRSEGGCVWFLSAEEHLSQSELEEKARTLEFHLKTKVVVDPLESYPEIGESGFKDLMDQIQRSTMRTMIAKPVAADLMTILVIEPELERLERIKKHLDGRVHRIIPASNVKDALRKAKSLRESLGMVLIPHDVSSGLESTIASLAKETQAQLAIIVDEEGQLTELDVADHFPTIDLSKSQPMTELANALKARVLSAPA